MIVGVAPCLFDDMLQTFSRGLESDALTVPPDPAVFSRDVLGITPDPWQADVLRSDARRMLLLCSRQAGKSSVAAVLALYTAMFTPGSLTLLTSPGLRQSQLLFRKITEYVVRMAERPPLLEDNKLSLMLANRSQIVALPGHEATIRGYSAVDLLIEDEAARVDDDLYYAVRPMLAVSGGRHIMMTTPWGKRGHFFEAWENGGDDWERVKITAYDVPRITTEFLEEERRGMSDQFFRAEYLVEFTDTDDSVFAHDDIMGAMDESVIPMFGGAA